VTTPTFDPEHDPIHFLPLRPWEVRRVRRELRDLLQTKQTEGSDPVSENVIIAQRAALAEHDAAGWTSRFRITDQRLEAIHDQRKPIEAPRYNTSG
jgi:hypothetical protein